MALFDEAGNLIVQSNARTNSPVNRANLPKLKPVTAEDIGSAVGKGANYLGETAGKSASSLGGVIGEGIRTVGDTASSIGEGVYNTAGAFGRGFMQGFNPIDPTAFDRFIANRKPPTLTSAAVIEAPQGSLNTVEKMPSLEPAKNIGGQALSIEKSPRAGGSGGYSGGGSGSVAGYLNSRGNNLNAMTRAGAIPVIRGNSTFYDIPLDNGGGSYHESFLAPGAVEGHVLMNRYGNDPHVAGHGLAKEASMNNAAIQLQIANIEATGHNKTAETKGMYALKGRELTAKPLDIAMQNQYTQEDNERKLMATLAKTKDVAERTKLTNEIAATRAEKEFQKQRVHEIRNLQLQLPGMPQPPDQSSNY